MENENYFHYNSHFTLNNKTCTYDKNKCKYIIDYKKYIDSKIITEPVIQTVVFDYNNSSLLVNDTITDTLTQCINNTEFNKKILIDKIISIYDRENKSEIENILLVNSWNDWNHQTAMEPSNKYKYYNLNLLYSCLNSDK